MSSSDASAFTESEHSKRDARTVRLLVLVSTALVLNAIMYVFHLQIMRAFFFAELLYLPIWAFTIGTACYALVSSFIHQHGKVLIVITLMVVSALYLAFAQPGYAFAVRADFERYRAEREKVIGQWVPEDQSEWPESIPVDDRLAESGRVRIRQRDEDTIFCFPLLWRGFDNIEGFVYTASGDPPHQGDVFRIIYRRRIDDHWFYIRTS